ncbi:hypothetical protein LZ30DRAFT_798880, partial [Colletotrichum cereale]
CSEIRLASILDVWPASEGETSSSTSLDLELCKISLDNHEDRPEFLAICHAPGESTTITLDGQRKDVSVGLFDALHNLHGRFGSKDKPVYLWASEICVNHQDPTEHASQSLLMPRIYQEAKKVVVWLGGPEGDRGRGLFAFVRVWSRTLMEWKEWTGSLKPHLPLLRKLEEVMRTAWKTWDENLVSMSAATHGSTSPGAAAVDPLHANHSQTAQNEERNNGNRVGRDVTELIPVTTLLEIFRGRAYWAQPDGFRHSCDPKDCIILCGKHDIVVGLSEISRVFLWIANFGRDLVADEQKPESLSVEVWDVLTALVVEIPNLADFQYLVIEEDRLR